MNELLKIPSCVWEWTVSSIICRSRSQKTQTNPIEPTLRSPELFLRFTAIFGAVPLPCCLLLSCLCSTTPPTAFHTFSSICLCSTSSSVTALVNITCQLLLQSSQGNMKAFGEQRSQATKKHPLVGQADIIYAWKIVFHASAHLFCCSMLLDFFLYLRRRNRL